MTSFDARASGMTSEPFAALGGIASGQIDNPARQLNGVNRRRQDQPGAKQGRLSSAFKPFTPDTQWTSAWPAGSDGERRLAASLQRRLGDRVVLLHDRRVPNSMRNIAHIAIAPSGVWVIDAKAGHGEVQRRDGGSFLRPDYRLFVNGRDRTRLAEGMAWQVRAVREAVAQEEVPVHAALCFTNAEWGLFAKPFQIKTVWMTYSRRLAEIVGEPGPLEKTQVELIAATLARTLPPAIQAR